MGSTQHPKSSNVFRGKSYIFWIEEQTNESGNFLRLSKSIRGVVKNVIIPSGFQVEGWKKFAECLGSFLSGGLGGKKVERRLEEKWETERRLEEKEGREVGAPCVLLFRGRQEDCTGLGQRL